MAGILDLFIPKEKKFFEYIDKQIVLLSESTEILSSLIDKERVDEKNFHKSISILHQKSHDVDEVSKEIVSELHKTFITPIDRDEIKTLSTHLGFIVDSLEKIAAVIYFYKIKKLNKHFLEQATILFQAIKLLIYIFEEPLKPKRNKEKLQQIKELEREADRIYRIAIGDLFSDPIDAIDIIKYKELHNIAEDTIDDICHISDLLETIIINNS